MPRCIKCGTEFNGEHCPACGESRRLARARVLALLFLWVVGLCAYVIVENLWPLLDEWAFTLLSLFFFLLPLAVMVPMSLRVRRGLPYNIVWFRRVFVYSVSALVTMNVFLVLNSLADRSPVLRIRTSVVRKDFSYGGKYGPYYSLVVSSWRPGRDREKLLRVDWNTYRTMFVGEEVVVEVHPGLFRLPWYGRISSA